MHVLEWFLQGFKKPKEPKKTIIHDYFYTTWGHSYTVMSHEGRQYNSMGWGPKHGGIICEGDFLRVRTSDKEERYFLVDSISYLTDPRDMWDGKFTLLDRGVKPIK